MTSWTILDGIWLANGRPMPANEGVWAHPDALVDRPPEVPPRDVFLGDAGGHGRAALQAIGWTLARIEGPSSSVAARGRDAQA